jgi:tetratricopeptide (TPR) repeat protein
MVSLNLRHFEAAQGAFDVALAIKPDMAEVLAHRGRLHLQLGRFGQAEADFDAALKIDPALDLAWRGKAQLGILTGKIAQATMFCNKALAQNPNSEIATTLLGACYAHQGDIATAVDLFDRALATKPDYERGESGGTGSALKYRDDNCSLQIRIPIGGLLSATYLPISGVIRRRSPSCRCCGITIVKRSRSFAIRARHLVTP